MFDEAFDGGFTDPEALSELLVGAFASVVGLDDALSEIE